MEASVNTEAPVAGNKDFKTSQRTPEYQIKMDLDVHHIDNNDNNTWRTIYETIHEPYSGQDELFSIEFLNHCKKKKIFHRIFHLK